MGPTGSDGSGPTFSPALFYVGDGPERFEKAFAEIGAVWLNRETIVKLCEHCYARGVKKETKKAGVV